MENFLEKMNSFVWGSGLIFILLFTGTIYTVKLRFIQFRIIPFLMKNAKKNLESNKGMSQWKTVCMSLGTAMGTGNITGVAAAVTLGGAGAIFWMWISALLGMALVYAENSLSVTYSTKECRGPMGYLKNGLGSPILAGVFAVMCLAASVGMGGMIQVSSLMDSVKSTSDVSSIPAAVIIFLMIFIVTSGGAKRIGSAAQALLPAASIIYAVMCVWVLICCRSRIPEAFRMIFAQALGYEQAASGGIGYAISIGIRRGIFSNEAGLGSSPVLHSAAESDSPYLQGMWSMFEVFFDTIICCTLTALVVICSFGDGSASGAFSAVIGDFSEILLSAVMAVFAFCTIIGWYYCGETAWSFLSGRSAGKGFSAFFSAFASLGAVISLNTIWIISDIFNGLMAFPNLLGLILLIKKVKKE
ncbi:MAG: sodium:alanine symporter family protein [Ruminococcus sp.]|nr:sodium:alanine symporter family protein [Ruminococcus sp.]